MVEGGGDEKGTLLCRVVDEVAVEIAAEVAVDIFPRIPLGNDVLVH